MFDLADPPEGGHGASMASKLALAACITASLAACSPSADSSSATGDATRARAKWALPLETDPADNQAQAGNASVPINETVANATNSAEEAEKDAKETASYLPNSDPATYRARGTEPFWSVTVVGGTLVLDRPGKPARYFAVSSSTAGGQLRYNGDGVQMTSTPDSCSDGMSERHYGDRVQISLADGVLKGCGSGRIRK